MMLYRWSVADNKQYDNETDLYDDYEEAKSAAIDRRGIVIEYEFEFSDSYMIDDFTGDEETQMTIRLTINDILSLLDEDQLEAFQRMLSCLVTGDDDGLRDLSWQLVGSDCGEDGNFMLVSVMGTLNTDDTDEDSA